METKRVKRWGLDNKCGPEGCSRSEGPVDCGAVGCVQSGSVRTHYERSFHESFHKKEDGLVNIKTVVDCNNGKCKNQGSARRGPLNDCGSSGCQETGNVRKRGSTERSFSRDCGSDDCQPNQSQSIDVTWSSNCGPTGCTSPGQSARPSWSNGWTRGRSHGKVTGGSWWSSSRYCGSDGCHDDGHSESSSSQPSQSRRGKMIWSSECGSTCGNPGKSARPSWSTGWTGRDSGVTGGSSWSSSNNCGSDGCHDVKHSESSSAWSSGWSSRLSGNSGQGSKMWASSSSCGPSGCDKGPLKSDPSWSSSWKVYISKFGHGSKRSIPHSNNNCNLCQGHDFVEHKTFESDVLREQRGI